MIRLWERNLSRQRHTRPIPESRLVGAVFIELAETQTSIWFLEHFDTMNGVRQLS
jgi:hypothetical protein